MKVDFVARKIDRKRGDLLRRAEATERLARDESRGALSAVAAGRDALIERGRRHRARADRIAADLLPMKSIGDGFGEADEAALLVP